MMPKRGMLFFPLGDAPARQFGLRESFSDLETIVNNSNTAFKSKKENLKKKKGFKAPG